ncbi:MAG TPA: response regulator transcription factor [Candidatus Methylacidiphilales bacterium]|nr:response regulator transcription factor [Candidatus Methylacidiphilales bacterium]
MRLLLVEDSIRLQRSLTLGLRKSGYAVDVIDDGRDALFQALAVDYDVIILDIMIPSLDGLSVLEELRAQGKKTHVLLLTARDTVEDRVKGLQMGADDYLIKPFAFDELLARVQTLCRRSYFQKSPRIEIQDLVINLATQGVSFHDHPIELLPREFRLLEYLALRRGETVSRPEIEARLYDEKMEVMSNVIDSTICQLRKKLAQAGSAAVIHTKRGMGYCIEE